MIVVAIIGVLATVGIVSFVDMQYRAKRSETSINVASIAVSQASLNAVMDTLITGPINPSSPLNKVARDFDGSMSGWSTLGWAPDGKIRCSYSTEPYPISNPFQFSVTASCDVDNDDEIYTVTYSAPRTSGQASRRDVNDPHLY
jgi:type II secretory pathway pseudopilin PulG